MSKKIATIIATYFGLGLSPKAPGTMGSLGTLPLAFVLIYYSGIYGIIAMSVVCYILGVWATNEIIKDSDNKDPGKVVIDEVVGQLLAFSLVTGNLSHNISDWWIYLTAFAAFRFFDICKMGPVKWFDSKVKNAYGVMSDDVCAGIFASVVTWAIVKYLPLYLQ